MLSQNTAYVLEVAISNAKLADEIAARLIASAPVDAAAAQAVLDILDKNLNKQIEEYLIVSLAHRPSGKEIAKKVNGLIAVLEAQANGDDVAAVAAQFQGQVAGMTTDVTIDADVAGVAGNITLTADSVTDIDGLISAWNIANVGNEVTLSAGDGSQVPTADITLADGADASDTDIAPAQAAMGSEAMSDEIFERLVIALASRPAAQEIRSAYDAMVTAAQAI